MPGISACGRPELFNCKCALPRSNALASDPEPPPRSFFQSAGGDNYVEGGSGNDTVFGWKSSGTQISGSGNSTICGGSGSESIVGDSGNDTLYAGDGGTVAAPTPLFADLNDANATTTIYGGIGKHDGPRRYQSRFIEGGAGTDLLYAGDGGTDDNPTTVIAGSGTATLCGGAGEPFARGHYRRKRSDRGGNGDDTLVGIGMDTLVAGTGTDYFSATSGSETYARHGARAMTARPTCTLRASEPVLSRGALNFLMTSVIGQRRESHLKFSNLFLMSRRHQTCLTVNGKRVSC
jgi:Ca2+-binding RTX toxin-like protein